MSVTQDAETGSREQAESAETGAERRPPPRRLRIILQLGAALLLAGGALTLFLNRPPDLPSLVTIEFDPDPVAAAQRVAGRGGTVWWYVGCWVLGAAALAVVCDVGRRLLVSASWRILARQTLFGAVTAAVLALVEGLLVAKYPVVWWPGRIWVIRVVQAMAFARNCLLAVTLPVSVAVLVVATIRLYRGLRYPKPPWWSLGPDVIPRRRDGLRPPSRDAPAAAASATSVDVGAPNDLMGVNNSGRTAADKGVARHVNEHLWLPEGRKIGGMGICVSGGGIRSACVALGALQALQREGELIKADYLVSVSGGGYTAGAYQMALTDEIPGPAADEVTEPPTHRGALGERFRLRPRTRSHPPLVKTHAAPANVFRPGSPEEDHVRRHSNYVADSMRDWAAALGTLLRGVLVNLALLAATVTAIGGLLYLFYRYTHIMTVTDFAPIYALGTHSPSAPPRLPAIQQGVALATLAALILTVIAFSVGLAAFATGGAHAQRVAAAGRALATLTVVLTLFGVLLPLLLWATSRLTWSLGLQTGRGLQPAGIGTVLFTYFGAIVGILWRTRDRIGKRIGGIRARISGSTTSAGARRIGGGLVQRVVVGLALLVLASVFLLLLGWTATTATRWSPVAWVVLVAALAYVSVVLDQTWLGLHPFYRRRLATAFAVRRVRKQGLLRAERYDYDKELTSLSEYGKKHDGFPQVIFAGAANLSGSELTPPGRRAVSYTLSEDWIGGPEIGWVKTATVDGTNPPGASEHGTDRRRRRGRHRGGRRLAFGDVSRDVTVQAAVAVSGAAFASAMGGQARAYQTFFALSNARLGTWLPNPGYIAEHLSSAERANWPAPRLPRKRRLQYLLREIVGSYPDTNPLLFITDGGHYENLGLVELLRHRCKTIYCIDASGDSPPLATTLAQALTLAYEELGVTIRLHDPFHLVAGGGEPLQPKEPLSALSGRLSAAAVLTGDIIYPKRGTYEEEKGILVVAKASLTPDMPYEVLSYAQSNPVFPHDSTADQWFNVGQFDAYQAVGWHIGLAAADTLRKHQAPAQPPSETAATETSRLPAGQPAGYTADRQQPATTPAARQPQTSGSENGRRAGAVATLNRVRSLTTKIRAHVSQLRG